MPDIRNRPSLPAPLINSRLSETYESAPIVTYCQSSKMVFMSDCHRGIGSNADNFTQNQNIFHGALTYYNHRRFTYFELGDGDELWENRKYNDIIQNHCDTFALISEFYKDNRYYMIYGNHDMVKKNSKSCQLLSSTYNDCIRKNGILFPGIEIYEAILLWDTGTDNRILITHGHQGDLINDYLWRISRFLVRYVWRPLQLIGVQDPTSPTITNKKGNALEQKMKKWTKENHQMLICGHTHRPSYPEQTDVPYFNDGCCVHPHIITAIEIEDNKISLVKWSVKTDNTLSLYIGREILYGPRKLESFFLACG